MTQLLRIHQRSWLSSMLALCVSLGALFALASTAGAAGLSANSARAFTVPTEEGVALAQIATVRVVAQYTLTYTVPPKNTVSNLANVTCTGLGVLVQSIGTAGGASTSTLLLTSSEVLASDLACPQISSRVLPPGAMLVRSIFSGADIFLSRAYLGQASAAAATPLFILTAGDPDLHKAPTSPQPVLVELTPAAGTLAHDYPTVAVSPTTSAQQVILDLRSSSAVRLTNEQLNTGPETPTPTIKASDFLSPTSLPTTGALTEDPGAPAINATTGAVEGVLKNDGTVLPLTTVQVPNTPNTCPGEPVNLACLTHQWKTVMDAYYGGGKHDLTRLKTLVANPAYQDFGGAQDFLTAAMAPPQGGTGTSSTNPITITLVVLVILLIGVFLLILLIQVRARRRRSLHPQPTPAATFSARGWPSGQPLIPPAPPAPVRKDATKLSQASASAQASQQPQHYEPLPGAAMLPSRTAPAALPPPAARADPPAAPVISKLVAPPPSTVPVSDPIVPAPPPAPSAGMIFCPHCGLQQQIGSSPCLRCGFDLHQALTMVRGSEPNAPADSSEPPRLARVPANAPLPFAVALDGGQQLSDKETVAPQKGRLSGHMLGGKYQVEELLGRGGVGVVYKAYNQLLKRPQAIKVLLEHYLDDVKFRERFLREAQVLAALDHPNILPVHDFGVEEDRAYLVMPFISGGTLDQWLKRHAGPLDLGQASRAVQHIAAALDYAHAKGVVHLDLKPANMLLHPDGRLLLADFGLAHLMEEGVVEGSTSLQFGTPSYMAPEHIAGEPGPASDIYALGIILYQLLTGQLPFQGTHPRAILHRQATEPPPPLRVMRPDLPVALEGVLGKALAKKPAARYATAGHLLLAFQQAISP